jgi:hypothetical protein
LEVRQHAINVLLIGGAFDFGHQLAQLLAVGGMGPLLHGDSAIPLAAQSQRL